MNSTFKFTDVDSAIKKLQEIKKENKNGTIVICTVDFDNDKESRKAATVDEGCVLVRKSKTIIFNEDTIIPIWNFIQLYRMIWRILLRKELCMI